MVGSFRIAAAKHRWWLPPLKRGVRTQALWRVGSGSANGSRGLTGEHNGTRFIPETRTPGQKPRLARSVPGRTIWGILPENRKPTHASTQALLFNQNDGGALQSLAVLSILALLTISGAAYTDQVLIGEQAMHGAN